MELNPNAQPLNNHKEHETQNSINFDLKQYYPSYRTTHFNSTVFCWSCSCKLHDSPVHGQEYIILCNTVQFAITLSLSLTLSLSGPGFILEAQIRDEVALNQAARSTD
jgi:hypothetical protein